MRKPSCAHSCAPSKSVSCPRSSLRIHDTSRALRTNQPSPWGMSPVCVFFSSASGIVLSVMRAFWATGKKPRREDAHLPGHPRQRSKEDSQMTDSSLYERLGGAFAIAAVGGCFRGGIVGNPVGGGE